MLESPLAAIMHIIFVKCILIFRYLKTENVINNMKDKIGGVVNGINTKVSKIINKTIRKPVQ